MKKILLLTLFFWGTFLSSTSACSCAPPNSFCEGLSDENGNLYFDLIIRGTVKTNNGSGIKVKVDELLFGFTSENEISLTFDFCTIFTDPLDEGDEFIFAVIDRVNSYSLISCSISYLLIENETIKGKITPDIESLDYKNLSTLDECGNGTNIFSIAHQLDIFPNPTVDILKIKNKSDYDFEGSINIQFFDILGRELPSFKKENGLLSTETWSVNLNNLSAGVYFFKLTANGREEIFKIVKQ